MGEHHKKLLVIVNVGMYIVGVEMKMIDPFSPVVFFDFGGVIVRTGSRELRNFWELRLGIAPGEMVEELFGSLISTEAALGRVSAERAWLDFGLCRGLSASEVLDLRRDFWAEEVIDEAVLDFLRVIARCYPTAILSNIWSDGREIMQQRFALHLEVRQLILSSELGAKKPDPSVFKAAAAIMHCQPQDAILIDDAEYNVAAARKAGWTAIQFVDLQSARTEFEKKLTEA